MRTLDCHDDAFLYEGGTLRAVLNPETPDRDAEIEISGVGLVMDERIDDLVICRVPIWARIRFDPVSRRFEILEQVSPVPFAWVTTSRPH